MLLRDAECCRHRRAGASSDLGDAAALTLAVSDAQLRRREPRADIIYHEMRDDRRQRYDPFDVRRPLRDYDPLALLRRRGRR